MTKKLKSNIWIPIEEETPAFGLYFLVYGTLQYDSSPNYYIALFENEEFTSQSDNYYKVYATHWMFVSSLKNDLKEILDCGFNKNINFIVFGYLKNARYINDTYFICKYNGKGSFVTEYDFYSSEHSDYISREEVVYAESWKVLSPPKSSKFLILEKNT